MPRPTEDPDWATDSAYDAPGKAWDGVDPKLEPPAGLIAEGWEPGVAPNARFVNWLLNLFGRWLGYLRDERDRLAGYIGGDDGSSEWVYEAARVRAINVSPVGRIRSGDSKIVGGAAAGVLTQGQSLDNGWRPREIPLAGGGPGGTDTYSPAYYVRTGLPQHVGYIDLSPDLRTGMEILSVLVAVDPGTAQATASDRMKWSLMRRNLAAFAAAVEIASGTANNTGNQQVISATGLSITVDRETYAYWLVVWSSAGAAGTPDDLYGVTLAVNDPGPRNF